VPLLETKQANQTVLVGSTPITWVRLLYLPCLIWEMMSSARVPCRIPRPATTSRSRQHKSSFGVEQKQPWSVSEKGSTNRSTIVKTAAHNATLVASLMHLVQQTYYTHTNSLMSHQRQGSACEQDALKRVRMVSKNARNRVSDVLPSPSEPSEADLAVLLPRQRQLLVNLSQCTLACAKYKYGLL